MSATRISASVIDYILNPTDTFTQTPVRSGFHLYVVMGVAGSGKSTIGAALARALGVDFVEGDAYHSAENVARMASGIPLTDENRAECLLALAARIPASRDAGTGLVMTCSARTRAYPD